MNEVDDFFKKGILAQVFSAEYNFQIYKKIGLEYEFLTTQSKEVKDLFSYIQSSAITNSVLNTTKLYDRQAGNTRSILSFLNLVKSNANKFPAIVEIPNTLKILNESNVNQSLIESLYSDNTSIFPCEFYKFYYDRYNSLEIQTKIKSVKKVRDKVIAHNDVEGDSLLGDTNSVDDLLRFATEIISIYSMAYYSTIYLTTLKDQADRNSYFINSEIKKLKKKL